MAPHFIVFRGPPCCIEEKNTPCLSEFTPDHSAIIIYLMRQRERGRERKRRGGGERERGRKRASVSVRDKGGEGEKERAKALERLVERDWELGLCLAAAMLVGLGLGILPPVLSLTIKRLTKRIWPGNGAKHFS